MQEVEQSWLPFERVPHISYTRNDATLNVEADYDGASVLHRDVCEDDNANGPYSSHCMVEAYLQAVRRL